MRKSQHIIKTLLSILLVSCVCTSHVYAAVDNPQLDIQGVAGSLVSDGTDLSINALVISIITDGGPINIPDEAFSLDAVLLTGAGSLTAGPLLSATITNFTLFNFNAVLPGYGQFWADLDYTGGSMRGGLAVGRIEGAFQNANPADFTVTAPFTAFTADSVTAKIGPVAVVPVPAAVWLFGSGLLGLVGMAKRKNA